MKYRYVCNNCGHRFTSSYEDDCCPVCYDNDTVALNGNLPVPAQEENDYYPIKKNQIKNFQHKRPR